MFLFCWFFILYNLMQHARVGQEILAEIHSLAYELDKFFLDTRALIKDAELLKPKTVWVLSRDQFTKLCIISGTFWLLAGCDVLIEFVYALELWCAMCVSQRSRCGPSRRSWKADDFDFFDAILHVVLNRGNFIHSRSSLFPRHKIDSAKIPTLFS